MCVGCIGKSLRLSKSYAVIDSVAGSKGSFGGFFSFGGCFRLEPRFSRGTLYRISFGAVETLRRFHAFIIGNVSLPSAGKSITQYARFRMPMSMLSTRRGWPLGLVLGVDVALLASVRILWVRTGLGPESERPSFMARIRSCESLRIGGREKGRVIIGLCGGPEKLLEDRPGETRSASHVRLFSNSPTGPFPGGERWVETIYTTRVPL